MGGRSCAAPGDVFRAAAECADRAIKLTNAGRLDDWYLMRLPPYRTIVTVHEEELRKRHEPRVYEEYMLGVSRFLAEKADRNEISAIQLAQAFNAAWTEMVRETREDAAFRITAVQAAEQADAETWATFRQTASTIGLVLGGAILGAAAAGSYAPTPVVQPNPPVTCQAVSMGRNTVTGQSYGVTLRCQQGEGM